MKDGGRIIYSLCIEDIQTVANAEYSRHLSREELHVVEEKLGDYIRWYDLIDMAISNHVEGITHSD